MYEKKISVLRNRLKRSVILTSGSFPVILSLVARTESCLQKMWKAALLYARTWVAKTKKNSCHSFFDYWYLAVKAMKHSATVQLYLISCWLARL